MICDLAMGGKAAIANNPQSSIVPVRATIPKKHARGSIIKDDNSSRSKPSKFYGVEDGKWNASISELRHFGVVVCLFERKQCDILYACLP